MNHLVCCLGSSKIPGHELSNDARAKDCPESCSSLLANCSQGFEMSPWHCDDIEMEKRTGWQECNAKQGVVQVKVRLKEARCAAGNHAADRTNNATKDQVHKYLLPCKKPQRIDKRLERDLLLRCGL